MFGIIGGIIVGAIAGWIANIIMKGGSGGLIMNSRRLCGKLCAGDHRDRRQRPHRQHHSCSHRRVHHHSGRELFQEEVRTLQTQYVSG